MAAMWWEGKKNNALAFAKINGSHRRAGSDYLAGATAFSLDSPW